MEEFRNGAHDSRIGGRCGIPRAVVFIDLGLDRLNDNVDTINDGYYTRRLASSVASTEILWLFCFWMFRIYVCCEGFPDII
jgi:hypothetical protein